MIIPSIKYWNVSAAGWTMIALADSLWVIYLGRTLIGISAGLYTCIYVSDNPGGVSLLVCMSVRAYQQACVPRLLLDWFSVLDSANNHGHFSCLNVRVNPHGHLSGKVCQASQQVWIPPLAFAGLYACQLARCTACESLAKVFMPALHITRHLINLCLPVITLLIIRRHIKQW